MGETPHQTVLPGKAARYDFEITNHGETSDFVAVLGAPPGARAQAIDGPLSFAVGAGESYRLSVELKLDKTAALGQIMPLSVRVKDALEPTLATSTQVDTVVGESRIDGDTVLGEEDNCPDEYNPGQEDIDEDGVGDICDEDPDGDGRKADDNCPLVANRDQADLDRDGMGDVCDPAPDCGCRLVSAPTRPGRGGLLLAVAAGLAVWRRRRSGRRGA